MKVRESTSTAGAATRRQVITAAASSIAALAAGSAVFGRSEPTTPKRIFEILLDSKQFSAFSSEPAEISREAGG